jgi:endonuclease YncB( thermonuclease family)
VDGPSLKSRLRIGAPVTLLPQTEDRYGRTVAEVIGEINLGLEMVEDGQAYPLRGAGATPTASTWPNAKPMSIWMRSIGRPAADTWSGLYRGGITRPWDFRRAKRFGGRISRTSPTASRAGSAQGVATSHYYRCKEIGSVARAQESLKHGHSYLDKNGDGVACESLR